MRKLITRLILGRVLPDIVRTVWRRAQSEIREWAARSSTPVSARDAEQIIAMLDAIIEREIDKL